MGTPDFAVPILEALQNSDNKILEIYTQPAKKKDRGQKVQNSPVYDCAKKLKIKVRHPETLKENTELEYIKNLNPDIGLGSIGELEQSMSLATFLEHTKTSLKVPAIRHSASEKDQIKKVAVLGGSGSFCINAAIAHGADALVTADLKYHDFYTPEKGLLLVDAGHYETEHFTKKIIQEFLTKKIPNFAFTLSEVNTNPVKYF